MAIQVLGLCSLGIQAISLSSLTPKEEITAAYKRMDSDSDIRFVYGALSACPTDLPELLHSFSLCLGSQVQ